MVSFWEVMIFSVGSLIFIAENMLRCASATLTLKLPLCGLILSVTGVVMRLLMMTTVAAT